jgi:hypothetical protein
MSAISFEAIIAGIDAIPSGHLSRDHTRRLASLRAQLSLLAREMKVDDSDAPLTTIGSSSVASDV